MRCELAAISRDVRDSFSLISGAFVERIDNQKLLHEHVEETSKKLLRVGGGYRVDIPDGTGL